LDDDRIFEPYADGSVQPAYRSEKYASTGRMAPDNVHAIAPRTATELSGPIFAQSADEDRNLVSGKGGQAIGSLMRLKVRVLDEDARPQAGSFIEIWQANAAGKYQHPQDQRDAPIDPNFRSWGRGVVDANGEIDFITIRPGAYPVPNSGGWWRPPHIHLSAYGSTFSSHIITQLYFPGDPLNEIDGIFQGIPDPVARERLVLKPDADAGIPEAALGFRFDLVLRGRSQTPLEN
jgi:protocatechuate 3,4-dioxygenase beta subunit